VRTDSEPGLPHRTVASTEFNSRYKRRAVISDGVRQGEPVVRVIHGQGAFMLLDAALADENPDEHGPEAFHAICIHCLLDAHPEAARGMAIARRTGSARFHAGIWTAEMY
jgi:hypothetical protein